MPYELKRSEGKFIFNLKGEQQETILTSSPFPKKAEALAAIEAAQKLGTNERAFELKRAITGTPFFVLKAEGDQVLCRSEFFGSEGAAWRAMQAARKLCPSIDVRDWS